MPITVKLLDMIRRINSSGVTSLIENAKAIGISERNLRYKIDDYNYYLKLLNLPEIEIKKREILLRTTLEEVVNEVLKNMNLYSFTKDEREKIILTDLLFNSENISFCSLEDKLNVGDLTLRNDLKNIDSYLNTFVLRLDYRELKCLGEEKNIRNIILDILLKNYNIQYFEDGSIKIEKNYQYGFFIDSSKMDEYFDKDNVNKALKILRKILSYKNQSIGDENFKVLLFYIIIFFKRYELYDLRIKNLEFLEKSEEYKIVEESFLEYNLSKSELINMTEYLLGSHSFDFDISFYTNWVQIEILMIRLIKEVAKNGYEDLEKDTFLLENLINHIKPAIYRAKKGIKLPCEFYNEFKETYPLVLHLVYNAWNSIDINVNISDDELAYIAMHFQLAIKRIKTKNLENVLIVCGAGYSTSRFLMSSIKEYFNVNIVDIIPFNRLENYKNENIDIVITTVDGIKFKDVKVIKVSPILTTEDIIMLRNEKLPYSTNVKLSEVLSIVKQYSDNLAEEKFVREIKNRFGNLILDDIVSEKGLKFLDMLSPSRVTIVENIIDNWEEAIERSCISMVEEGYVGESYSQEIVELINTFGNYMVLQDGIFLGHSGNSESINMTGLSLTLFPNEIDILGEKVKVVLILSSKDKKEHLNGLMEFLEIIRNKDFIAELENLKSTNEVYRKIESFIQGGK